MQNRILTICGSIAQPSHTRALLEVIVFGLKAWGANPILFDLAQHQLGIADPYYHDAPELHPDPAVRALVEEANLADAFVLGSPLYHNSYSGVLKNCLDHLTIKQFQGKPVGLAGNGGSQRSSQACDHLRIVIRGLHGLAVVTQVVAAESDFRLIDGEYKVSSKDVTSRIARFISELNLFIERFRIQPAIQGDGYIHE